jgi:hypothetical protein
MMKWKPKLKGKSKAKGAKIKPNRVHEELTGLSWEGGKNIFKRGGGGYRYTVVFVPIYIPPNKKISTYRLWESSDSNY